MVALTAAAGRLDPSLLRTVADQSLVGPVTLGRLVGWALVPPLLAVPAYFGLQHRAGVEEQRPVYRLSLLDNPALAVPTDARLVHLRGVFQADYQYGLTVTSDDQPARTNRYAPLTGRSWRPGEPIRFFLNTSQGAYYDPATAQTFDFGRTPPFSGTFDGELSQGSLPTVVRQEFERRHLPVADAAYVLTETSSFGERPPKADRRYYPLVLWGGLGLSAALLLGGGLGLVLRRVRGPG